MGTFRLALLSVIVVACLLGFNSPIVLAQEENPNEIIVKPETKPLPARSIKPFIFPIVCVVLSIVFIAALITGLAFAYQSRKISASTTLFVAGAVLVTCPVFGIVANTIGYSLATANAFANMGQDAKAPDPKALANDTSNFISATFPLNLLMLVSFLAVPFGVIAIIAAFYFKKPAQAG